MYGYFVGDDPRQQEDPYLLDAGSAGNAINMTVGPQQSMPAQPQIMNPQQPSPGMNDLFKSLAMPQQGPIGTNAAYQAAQASPQQQTDPYLMNAGSIDNAIGMTIGQPMQQWASRASGMADASLIQGPSNPYAGQATIDDGFHGGYTGGAMPPQWNQQMTRNPYASLPFTDSFMDNGPIHTLGVSGFRTGSSRPSVDTHGMDQRAAIGRQSMAMMDMIGRQENAANSNQIDMARFGMQSMDRQDAIAQKRQAEFDRHFQKLAPGTRGGAIDQAEASGVLPKDIASGARLTDILDRASSISGMNRETGKPKDLALFLGAAAQGFDPNRVSRAEFINRLQGMGITADEVYKAKERNPALAPFVDSLMGKSSPRPGMVRNGLTEMVNEQMMGLLPGLNPQDFK